MAIQVMIEGRTYPVSIAKSEEGTLREAADSVNSLVAKLKTSYAVSDRQDLLAMAALQLSMRAIKAEVSDGDDELRHALEEINRMLDD